MSNETNNQVIRMGAALKERLFSIIEGEHRSTFIPEQFGGIVDGMVIGAEFERNAYTWAREESEDYNAGSWVMVKTKSRDSFFIYPADENGTPVNNEEKMYRLEDYDEIETQVDAITFGLIASLVALEKGTCRPMIEQSIVNIYDHKSVELSWALEDAVNELEEIVSAEEHKMNDDLRSYVFSFVG